MQSIRCKYCKEPVKIGGYENAHPYFHVSGGTIYCAQAKAFDETGRKDYSVIPKHQYGSTVEPEYKEEVIIKLLAKVDEIK